MPPSSPRGIGSVDGEGSHRRRIGALPSSGSDAASRTSTPSASIRLAARVVPARRRRPARRPRRSPRHGYRASSSARASSRRGATRTCWPGARAAGPALERAPAADVRRRARRAGRAHRPGRPGRRPHGLVRRDLDRARLVGQSQQDGIVLDARPRQDPLGSGSLPGAASTRAGRAAQRRVARRRTTLDEAVAAKAVVERQQRRPVAGTRPALGSNLAYSGAGDLPPLREQVARWVDTGFSKPWCGPVEPVGPSGDPSFVVSPTTCWTSRRDDPRRARRARRGGTGVVRRHRVAWGVVLDGRLAMAAASAPRRARSSASPR